MDLIQAITILETIRETNFSDNLPAGKERNKALDIAISKLEKQQPGIKWLPITNGLPPVGSCLIVTVKDHYNKQLELRYPVWYMEKPYGRGYAFYFGEIGNILMPDISEVIAWMPMPTPYEPHNLDWSERLL